MRDYRQDFSDFSPTVYLDCAYQGPFPRVTAERLRQAIELKCRPERLEAPDYFDLPERVRARLARLVGADADEIVLTTSATQGISAIATGLDFKPGNEVVVANMNFPANLYTWLHLRRLGVRTTVLDPRDGMVRVDDVAAAMTWRTQVLALDWVSYTSGVKIDLAEFGDLAHKYNALFVVDATQGAGALELRLHELPVDAVAVAGYKWLLGPYGTGFAYLSWDAQDRLDVPVINWSTVEGAENFDALPVDQFTLPHSAKVFDVPETANFINLNGVEASLEYIEGVGVATVERHAKGLLARLANGLRHQGYMLSRAVEPEFASTILGFQARSPEATRRLHRELRDACIAVSLRHGMIRVSPYLYNDEGDIDRLLAVAQGSSDAP